MELIETLFPEEATTKNIHYQHRRTLIDRDRGLQQVAKAKAILNSKVTVEPEIYRFPRVRVIGSGNSGDPLP